MAQPISHTPVYREKNYDGNGAIHQIEKERGVVLKPHKSGKGFLRIDANEKHNRIATLNDASVTKQVNKIDEIEKRQDKTDKKIDDLMAMMKELLKKDKNEGEK